MRLSDRYHNDGKYQKTCVIINHHITTTTHIQLRKNFFFSLRSKGIDLLVISRGILCSVIIRRGHALLLCPCPSSCAMFFLAYFVENLSITFSRFGIVLIPITELWNSSTLVRLSHNQDS